MRTVLALALVLVLTPACDEQKVRKEKQVDAASFRRMLQCASRRATPPADCESARDAAAIIESIRIEPTSPSSARYVITRRDGATRDVVNAEFPGQITNEITDAEIPYSVAN